MVGGACVLSTLFNSQAYFWFLSLNATIAAINNTIAQSSVAVTYIFSVLLIPNYNMSWIKNLGVLTCLTGVFVVGYGTRNESDDRKHNTWYGLLEEFTSMLGWGLSQVAMGIVGTRYFSNIGDSSSLLERVKSQIFMQGLMGAMCLLTFWPGILILHFAGIEPFEQPQNRADILVLAIPSCLSLLFVTSLLNGIAFTNPVFIAVSQLMVIPVGFLWDVVFNGLTISAMAVLGAVFILIGFLIMELPTEKYAARLLDFRRTQLGGMSAR